MKETESRRRRALKKERERGGKSEKVKGEHRDERERKRSVMREKVSRKERLKGK